MPRPKRKLDEQYISSAVGSVQKAPRRPVRRPQAERPPPPPAARPAPVFSFTVGIRPSRPLPAEESIIAEPEELVPETSPRMPHEPQWSGSEFGGSVGDSPVVAGPPSPRTPSPSPAGAADRQQHNMWISRIASVPGWERGIAECLDTSLHPRDKGLDGIWRSRAPHEWSKELLKALSLTAEFAKPADLNERLQKKMESRVVKAFGGIRKEEIYAVFDDLMDEGVESLVAEEEEEEAKTLPWTSTLAHR